MPRRVISLMATMSMLLATTAMTSPLLRATTTKMTTTSTPRMATFPTTTKSTPLAMLVSTSPLQRATTTMILSVPPHGGQDDLILSAKLIRIAPETSFF